MMNLTFELRDDRRPNPLTNGQCPAHVDASPGLILNSNPSVTWLGPGFDQLCCLGLACALIRDCEAVVTNPDAMREALTRRPIFRNIPAAYQEVVFVNDYMPGFPDKSRYLVAAEVSGDGCDPLVRCAIEAVLAAHDQRGLRGTDKLLGQLEAIVRVGGPAAERLNALIASLAPASPALAVVEDEPRGRRGRRSA